ncbi:hypothetical protein PRIC1_008585 [Phytophthora ramorum]|nr:hypothetical protein KRP22_6028 [Phytophthora ramorum]
MMNETAINDARDYVKAIKDVDEAMAIEQHSQIMELVVSINQEKEKRASALAALIMFTWTGNKDTLLSVLNEKPSAARKNEASHEKLGAISCRIEQKNNELETLKMHLNEQLEWVRDIPSSVSESGKALRFKALRKLSRRLTKEQTARKQLQKEREDILMCFLQDEETRKLVKKLL